MATAPELSTPWSNPCDNGCFCGTKADGSQQHHHIKMGAAAVAAATTSFEDFGSTFQSSISNKEKISALNDLHGCPDIRGEDPEMVAEKLAQLDIEIQKRTTSSSLSSLSSPGWYGGGGKNARDRSAEAYLLAYRQDKEYVEDKKFRLSFLRADTFCVKDAVQRLFSHFEHKLQLFGEDKLTKPILYQDLSGEDIDTLNNGSVQMLPLKDRAGRYVFVYSGATRRDQMSLESYVSNSLSHVVKFIAE